MVATSFILTVKMMFFYWNLP